MVINDIEELKKLDETALREYVEGNKTQYTHWGLPVVEIGGNDYAIALDELEADKAVTESIQDSVWAFNPDFIADMTGLPVDIFTCIANSGMCESANGAVLACINTTCGINEFVTEACEADGRGHFLNSWDGEEIELTNSNAFAYIV